MFIDIRRFVTLAWPGFGFPGEDLNFYVLNSWDARNTEVEKKQKIEKWIFPYFLAEKPWYLKKSRRKHEEDEEDM